MTRTWRNLAATAIVSGILAAGSQAADIIRDGKALGAIWIKDASKEFLQKQEDANLALDKMGSRSSKKTTDKKAAEYLGAYVEKMTGVKLEIKDAATSGKPDAKEPAIIMGELALDLGLEAPPKTMSWDGYRLKTMGNHLLMAGESGPALEFAVTHFLERFGYRWLTWGKLGEAIPEIKTISLTGFDVSETPDFLFRCVWGADFVPTRGGGIDLPNQHNWPFITKEKYYDTHPEYFALRNGERVTGGLGGTWVCTTHPDVIKIFADGYIAMAKAGAKAASISPPDGRSFCECERCRALDVPGYVEPSNGALCMSDRYVTFFDAVAKLVKKEAPDFILSFYAYSDYTLPPKNIAKVSDNLCAWITTIRFCRLHSFGNPNCEAAARYKDVVERWAAMGIKTASYDYNYNLSEVTVPISKISYFRERIPFLKKTGCLGINLEAMSAGYLYAPHTYLAYRLMWDADADADALLDDFYDKFGGKAAPHIKAYWERIDKAVTDANVHCGSFYGVHKIWTPELIAACQKDLDAAAKAADTDATRARVAMTRAGLDSAVFFTAWRDAVNRCDFEKANATFDAWLAHMNDAFDKGYTATDGYKRGYAERILGRCTREGFERVTGGRRLVAQLPDVWQLRFDPANEGESNGWFKAAADPESWQPVKTYSATLDEQGIPEQLTWMWYRTTLAAPKDLPQGPLHLWFGEVDGRQTKVWINGEFAGEFSGSRKPGEVEVTGKIKPGQDHEVVIQTHHDKISELKLGGLLRPAMLYAGPRPEPPAPAAKPEKKADKK
jgi:hypothetical protein